MVAESVYTELTAAARAERTRAVLVDVEQKLHDCEMNLAVNAAIAASKQGSPERRSVQAEVDKLRRERAGYLAALPILRARHEHELAEAIPEEE